MDQAWVPGSYSHRHCRFGAACHNTRCGFAHPATWPHHNQTAGQTSEPEYRVDPSDGNAYTQSQFIEFYGGVHQWNAAAPTSGVGSAGSSHQSSYLPEGSMMKPDDMMDSMMAREMADIEAAMMADIPDVYEGMSNAELDEIENEFRKMQAEAGGAPFSPMSVDSEPYTPDSTADLNALPPVDQQAPEKETLHTSCADGSSKEKVPADAGDDESSAPTSSEPEVSKNFDEEGQLAFAALSQLDESDDDDL